MQITRLAGFSSVVMFCAAAFAQTAPETQLHVFSGTDGRSPQSLVQALDGNFYGVTSFGGNLTDCNGDGCGTFFQITPQGAFTSLYSFTGDTDGGEVSATVTQGPDGNFYGTTNGSITNSSSGTLFEITPTGLLTTLYTFCQQTNCADGLNPAAPLILGSDGNFYGTTLRGGAPGAGTIFEYSGGIVTTLYSFCSATHCNDGVNPYGLVQGSDGNFYGVTNSGGTDGYGVLFQLTNPGHVYTVLASFDGSNGFDPVNALTEYSDGLLYGTTMGSGGGAGGYGNIFSLTTGGTLTQIYAFSNGTDGEYAESGLFVGSDGNFYGATADAAGEVKNGTVYSYSNSAGLSTLYTFGGPDDGSSAESPLLQGQDGNLYGGTDAGGANSDGTVFKITTAKQLAAPVSVALSTSNLALGSKVTVSYTVRNAFSTTMQQCYEFATTGGVTTALGKLAGSYSSSTHLYTGSMSYSPPAAGTYSLALTCGGIESGTSTLTVFAPGTNGSATTLAAVPNPASIGQSVTLTATVSKTSGSEGTPTGSVTFYYAGQAFASATLNGSGVASYTASTATLLPATYGVTAVYSGDTNYMASTSSSVNVVLNKATTATMLSASPTSVTPPGAVTFTATVARTATGASGAPAGEVDFLYGNTLLGTGSLNSGGVATFTASSSGVPANTYAITAKYTGDSKDMASMSSAINVTVK